MSLFHDNQSAAACYTHSVDCIQICPDILVKISAYLFYLQEQKGG